MSTVAKVSFYYSDNVEAFSFTTNCDGYPDFLGREIANVVYKSRVTDFLCLATNTLATVSCKLPKRVAVVPLHRVEDESYFKYVSYNYEVRATDDYEDVSKLVRDCIIIKISYPSGELVFEGTADQLREYLKEEGE